MYQASVCIWTYLSHWVQMPRVKPVAILTTRAPSTKWRTNGHPVRSRVVDRTHPWLAEKVLREVTA